MHMGKEVAAGIVVADHVQLALGLKREVHPHQKRVLNFAQDVALRHGVHYLAFVRDFLCVRVFGGGGVGSVKVNVWVGGDVRCKNKKKRWLERN